MTVQGKDRWAFPKGSFEPRNLLLGIVSGLALIGILLLAVYAL